MVMGWSAGGKREIKQKGRRAEKLAVNRHQNLKGIILSLVGRTPRCNQCSNTAIVGKLIYLKERSATRKLPTPILYHPAIRW